LAAHEGDRRFAAIWHLAWVVAACVMGGVMAWQGAPAPGPEFAALGSIGAAALFGAVAAATGGGTAGVLAILVWAIAGAAACSLTGGIVGPFAIWCLTPLAAGAAFGRPRLLALGAAAGVGAAAVAALASVLLVLPKPADGLSIWFSLLALGTTGMGVAAGLVAFQGQVRGDLGRWRETELDLRETLERQSLLLLTLYPGGRIIEAFGVPSDGLDIRDLRDRNFSDLVAADDRAWVEDALTRAAAEGSAEVTFVPSYDPQGWCVLTLKGMSSHRLLASIRDARSQRARETELEQARISAEQQNAGKSRFLANMSHELRTPLNAIMGFSDIMRQRLFGPMSDRYSEYAELIHESGAHLLELINDVLDMSKIEAERFELSREDFDARDAISAVLRLMRGQADRAGINLRGSLPAVPLEAEADRRAVKQIAMNLLSNALKFTPRGGAVTISARGDGRILEIVVADTGVGIAREDLARLGRPFEQAGGSEQRQAGSGLGLSLVRAFARLHGGDMDISSIEGEGTTVTVRMPVLVPTTQIPLELDLPPDLDDLDERDLA
jgi:cell cycle sensor histidine kinase DivJ